MLLMIPPSSKQKASTPQIVPTDVSRGMLGRGWGVVPAADPREMMQELASRGFPSCEGDRYYFHK